MSEGGPAVPGVKGGCWPHAGHEGQVTVKTRPTASVKSRRVCVGGWGL